MSDFFYPVFLNLNNQKCLVVGGGKVAERKVISLLECGAQVKVVSPEITEKLQELVASKSIVHICREYCSQDLESAFLVVSATASEELNKKISQECRERNILVNVVDDPDKCSFIVPSVVRRGDLAIAISTSGKSPALAKKIRQELETHYGREYEEFLEIMGEVRKKLLSEVSSQERRKEIFTKLVQSDILDLLKSGKKHLVEERIAQCISL